MNKYDMILLICHFFKFLMYCIAIYYAAIIIGGYKGPFISILLGIIIFIDLVTHFFLVRKYRMGAKR